MDSQITELETNIFSLVSEIEKDFSPDRLTKTKSTFDKYIKEIDDYLNNAIRKIFQIFWSQNIYFYKEENKNIKAKYLYLKGKLLDVLPEYSKQAEESLSKSVIFLIYFGNRKDWVESIPFC